MRVEFKNASILTVLAILGYFILYGLNVFLAQHLTPEYYGEFSVAVKILNILMSVSLFGTNIGGQRFLSKYLQLHNRATAADYIAWNIKLISITFLITLLLAAFSFILLMLFHYLGVRDINHYHLAIYMMWITPIAAFSSLTATFLLSTHRVFVSTLISNILPYLIEIIFFLGVVVLFSIPISNIVIVIILFLSYFVLSIFAISLMDKEMLLMILKGLKKFNKTPVSNLEWFQTSSRLIANHIIFSIVTVLDLLIVEFFAKNDIEVGHYAAVLTIVSVIWLIPSNLYQGLKPKLANLLTTPAGLKKLQHHLDKLNLVVTSFILILATGIIYYSIKILATFGLGYCSAQPALIILTIGVSAAAIGRIAPVILIYAGFEKLLLKWSIIELILMVVLVIPATYYYNLIGTATATSVVLCLRPIVTLFIVRHKFGIRPILIF